MRLLVVTQYFWPENFRINDLVAEFVRRGHEVTVLTGWPNYPDGKVFDAYRQQPERFTVFEGAKVIRVPLVPRGRGGLRLVLNYLSFALFASVWGVWKLRGRKFDAVLVYEPSPITVGIPGILMRAMKRAPMALWVLDLWPETLQAVGAVKSKWGLKLVGRLVTFIYRRCDLILAQSKSFIPQIHHYAGKNRRIEYFPSWAESIFDCVTTELAPEVKSLPEGFTVMFAGNIGEAQDFPAILRAAEALRPHPHIRWLIVGDGRMGQWVAQEIVARSLEESVFLLGRHPVERMPSFFAHADALLVSLKDEPVFAMTIPGKLQSYLAAGIPVLAMLSGEGADLIAHSGAGGACAAGDHAALSREVLRMAALTPVERQAMGQRAKDLYQREFEREHLINKMEHWLTDLVDLNAVKGRPQ